MKDETIRKLNTVNLHFYETVGESFSESRKRPWDGWSGVAQAVEALFTKQVEPCNVLDIGCGNMRFESYLQAEYPDKAFHFDCIDACATMAKPQDNISFFCCDIVESLLEDAALPIPNTHSYDAAVAFGLMHHIPDHGLRCRLMKRLAAAVRPDGIIAVSFWQFLSMDRFSKKADALFDAASSQIGIEKNDLEESDRFLGWKDVESVYRFCHSFDDDEISSLIDSVRDELIVIANYAADTANRYVILRKR